MTINPLPPQAYTRETLIKASQWVVSQSPEIQKIASNNPDYLVSLYLKAQRDGSSALERPSIQNFKNELKNISGMMGDLERPLPQPPTLPASSTNAPQNAVIPNPDITAPLATSPQHVPFSSTQSPVTSAPSSVAKNTVTDNAAAALFSLDPQTMMMIQEVKIGLNLSSESEAVRMLIKIGHTKASSLLKT